MLVVKTIPNQVRVPSHHRAGMPRFAESSTASRRGADEKLGEGGVAGKYKGDAADLIKC